MTSDQIQTLRFVVEGIGDVSEKRYAPALEQLKNDLQNTRQIIVTFTDDSRHWRDDSSLAPRRRATIDQIKGWGADYLDKSNSDDLKTYRNLQTDFVFVATPDRTHTEVAETWLKKDPRPVIFIEKPLEADLNAARRLLGQIRPYDDRVIAFDHYRARMLLSKSQLDDIEKFLGGGLKRFTFYFLEDHSGADTNYLQKNPLATRNGPIESEQRVDALKEGMILDGFPHMLALLDYFGRLETVRVTRVRAGQYTGVDNDPDKRTEIDKESFAEVEFVFADHAGNLVEGRGYTGKGVRGVKALGSDYDRDAKLLEIEGRNGKSVRFDLRGSGQKSCRAYLIDQDGSTKDTFSLHQKAYQALVKRIAQGTYLEDNIGLNVEHGKRILEVLGDMRYPILEIKNQGQNLPTYPSGMQGQRESLYLEDLLEGGAYELSLLYGG
ncbi:Gfo/Idh/MocA family oxidoreductase [Candidatus Poribacteria bacterium]|nr:Gfo/Idh/MocA family oxidoreductase [Candidatus Poribacteria bacterium]